MVVITVDLVSDKVVVFAYGVLGAFPLTTVNPRVVNKHGLGGVKRIFESRGVCTHDAIAEVNRILDLAAVLTDGLLGLLNLVQDNPDVVFHSVEG